jgi:hypothetical protein
VTQIGAIIDKVWGSRIWIGFLSLHHGSFLSTLIRH